MESLATNRVLDQAVRDKLLARRERLRQAVAVPPRTRHLEQLLDEVDLALAKIEQGTFGICETCHEPLESERILTDPLARNCLDHLSPAEQRALERDLDLAYQVQQGLLPKSGRAAAGWTLAYHYEPAGPVSGDYCDLIPHADGAALVLLGDVSGKGVAASMMMTQLHAMFRSLALGTRSVSDLVGRANRIFSEGAVYSFFATLTCGRLGRNGEVELCNAGHCQPLHVHDGQVTALTTNGLPLGIFGDGDYGCQSTLLQAGESLILYTDGLSEAFDPAGHQYGTDRLADFLRRRGSQAPKELVQGMVDEVRSFRDGGPKTDDLTIMVLRRDEALQAD
jgi:sigma-B regulation protein RsbU (phosphoserine phosphatase)